MESQMHTSDRIMSAQAEIKRHGRHYTPRELAEFIAERLLFHAPRKKHYSVLDPAVGEGILLEAVCSAIHQAHPRSGVDLRGIDVDGAAIGCAAKRLSSLPGVISVDLRKADFLEDPLSGLSNQGDFLQEIDWRPDLIIANPPYVRTQALGGATSSNLSERFKLGGRVDLSSAFVVGMINALKPGGLAAFIVSNRFMKTEAGQSLRGFLQSSTELIEIWDMGDTRLFEAAVLPAVLIVRNSNVRRSYEVECTSIYSTPARQSAGRARSVFSMIREQGVYEDDSGKYFEVIKGSLKMSGSAARAPWTIRSASHDTWVQKVEGASIRWKEKGRVRVGIKTTADKVFIREEWRDMPVSERPELVRHLITHHSARRWHADESAFKMVLYTHEVVDGKRRAIGIEKYPRSLDYLSSHHAKLAGRSYIRNSSRNWYEIWVPQDPAMWKQPKLVFRDICEEPCFWVDDTGAVVNGDCYWVTPETAGDLDTLYLMMAIGNSEFIKEYYDRKFNNRLYAGRRRFLAQYVAEFPMIPRQHETAAEIISIARELHGNPTGETPQVLQRIDGLIRQAFGVSSPLG